MTTVRLSEQIVLLADHSVGLLNAAHGLIKFTGPKFTDADLEKFMQKLGKEFPKAADKLRFSSSEKGCDSFAGRASEISQAYSQFFYTFSDAHYFHEQCIKLFREIHVLQTLDFETNTQLFATFFTLVTNWIKLHLLMARACGGNYDTVRTIIQSFSRAQFLITGNTEKRFNDAAAYAIDWYTSKGTVYQKVRNILDPHIDGSIPNISAFIGASVQTTQRVLQLFESHSLLLQRNILGVLDKTEDVLRHKNEQLHQQLLLLPELREWVVYSLLFCPAELTTDQSNHTLLLALQDWIVLPLYRDEFIDIHYEMNELFSDYTIKSLKFKLSKYKQPIRDITEKYQIVVDNHIQYRHYLATELETLQKFCRISVSGVTIGPKISLILALLHLSTCEINWYYLHRYAVVNEQCKPYKSASKFTIPFDPLISDLINNTFLIRDLLLKHQARYVAGSKPASVAAVNTLIPVAEKVPSAFIQYYTRFLDLDLASFKSLYMSLFSAQSLPEPVRTILDSIITQLEQVKNSTDADGLCKTSFSQLRLNLMRLSVLFSTKSLFTPVPPQVAPLLLILQSLHYHTTFLDEFDIMLINKISPFKQMFWYLPVIQQDIITLTAGISGVSLQPNTAPPPPSKHAQHCVSIVRTLADAIYNVHKVCPHELQSISLRAATTIDNYLNLLTKAVNDGLVILSKFFLSLRRHVSPLYAIGLLQCDPRSLKQRQPGMESDLFNNTNPVDSNGNAILQGLGDMPPTGTQYTEPIRQRQSATFNLCAQLCRIRSIRIYTYDLSPREYMTTALQAQIRFLVRSQVVPKLADGTSMNAQVDEVLNSAEPDVTIQTNADNFMAIAKSQRELGMNQEGPRHQIRRPSLLMLSLLNIMYLFHDLDRECNVGIGEMMRLILTTEFTGVYPKCGGEHTGKVSFLSQNIDGGDVSAPQLKTPILTFICNWYMNLFSRDFEPMNITHNEMLDMYDGNPIGYDKSIKDYRYAPFWAHLYTDPTELRVLVALCGPRGIDFFNKHLIMIVQKFAKKIFDILVRNVNVLQQVRGRYTEPNVWTQAADQLVEKEELLLYTHVVGNALQFRAMLRTCLKNHVEEQVPLIADVLCQSVHVAQTFVSDYLFDKRVNDIKQFAEGIAMNDFIICDDLQLKDALRRLKAGPADARAWALLPELYGLVFFSQPGFTQRAKYLTSSEGFKNNLHLVAYAVRDLIGVFTALPEETKSIVPNAPEAIQSELRRFLRVAAFCIINLPSSLNKPSSPELMVLLEKYVDSCKGFISMSYFEDLIPYSSLRTHYIRFLEAQSTNGDRSSDE